MPEDFNDLEELYELEVEEEDEDFSDEEVEVFHRTRETLLRRAREELMRGQPEPTRQSTTATFTMGASVFGGGGGMISNGEGQPIVINEFGRSVNRGNRTNNKPMELPKEELKKRHLSRDERQSYHNPKPDWIETPAGEVCKSACTLVVDDLLVGVR